MGNDPGCWRRYVREVLKRLGYQTDVATIINFILAYLAEKTFDEGVADKRLAAEQFRGSNEQRLSSEAIRYVLHLDVGDGMTRRGRAKLLDHDPAASEVEDDPALLLHREELEALTIPALESLRPRDRKILWAVVVQELTYREAATELRIPVSSLHARVQRLLPILALQIVRSRNKK